MNNSKYVDQIAEHVLSHYIKRQSNDRELQNVEARIRNAKNQINDCTSAFVEAKNSTLRQNIENKIADYENLLKTLNLEKTQLELEKSSKMTKQDALDIVEKYLDIDQHSSSYKKQFIDATVKKVICFNDGLTIYFDLIDDKENYVL